MPTAALSPCLVPCCPGMAHYKGRCSMHARVQERTRYNVEARAWYSTPAWKHLRLSVLADQPVCVECRTAPSTLVDHRIPHRGDYAHFWNRNNLDGMCQTCHGRKTARGE